MKRPEKERPIPDEAAMARLLEKHGGDTAGLVLRLVWWAGLRREEICALTWEQVDLEASLLRLPDREVPIEGELAGFLRRREAERRAGQDYVALSRGRKPFKVSGVFTAARNAMNEEGLQDLRVYDLRHDYVRRQFARRPWHEALRVTGLSVSTYRDGMAGRMARAPGPGETTERNDEKNAADEGFALWRVLQTERDTPAGVALWLSNQLGLNLKEIADLTWDQVDLDAEVLRLPGREIALTAGTRRVLAEARSRRRAEDDPHVVLSARSRRPLDNARLAALLRDALIRGGLGERRPMDFRKSAAEDDLPRLMELARERGSITRAEAAERLGLSMGRAYERLRRLEGEGKLVLLKNRWYLPENAVPRAGREAAILRYIAERGPATSREIGDFVGLGRDAAAKRLSPMVKAGDLYRQGAERRYCLTEQGAKKLQNEF